jgi:hypothetical protein
LLLSVLALSTSLLITFRLEARNQQAPNVQVVGKIEQVGSADVVMSTVSTTRLSQTESLHISVVAYSSQNAKNCYLDETETGCNIIGFWRVRPDSAGAVQVTLTDLVPKSTTPFIMIEARAWMCGSENRPGSAPNFSGAAIATLRAGAAASASSTTSTTFRPGFSMQKDQGVTGSVNERTRSLNAHCSLIKAAGFDLPLVETSLSSP